MVESSHAWVNGVDGGVAKGVSDGVWGYGMACWSAFKCMNGLASGVIVTCDIGHILGQSITDSN